MPDITDSVGEGGANKVHDVALVQAMLSVIKDARNRAYLGDYDGKYGNTTKAAIIRFQTDQGLIKPAAKPGAGAPAAAAGEKEGLVAKNSDTLAKMVAAVPADYTEMRIIENASTVYFPGTEADCKASTAAINGTQDLEPGFRGKVALLVGKMFETHKIVLWLTGSGGHRSFEEQFQIFVKNKTTKAGPGESNHNFGRAVDIGFNKLQWLKGGGTIVKNEDWWLNKLTKDGKDKVGNAKAQEFWKARDAIAIPLGLWNSILDGDDDHLQSFDDHLPNDRALVDLMNRVGALKWEAEHNTPRRYLCDLGFGGKMYNVGKATDIWNLTATVTKAMIAEGRTEVLKAAALAKGPAAVKAVVPVKERDVKDEDVKNMRKSLKDDFLSAEKEWLKWRAVN
jgi:hypothetical protein